MIERFTYQQVKPASTLTMAPVIKLAALDARKRTAPATSSEVAILLIGASASQIGIRSRLASTAATIGVSIYVGATAFTLMPYCGHGAREVMNRRLGNVVGGLRLQMIPGIERG